MNNCHPLNIVILGLSITSSWGNGHATTFRSLTRALAGRGHRLLFLERDAPWYAGHRDLPQPEWCPTRLYSSLAELESGYADAVAAADLIIVGSYVPQGAAVGEWVCDTARGVTAFYDIDTPITIAGVALGTCDYLTPALIRRYGLYLSFTGGPLLQRLQRDYGAAMARPLYCCVDPELYCPDDQEQDHHPPFDLGYMGTYSADRQPKLERLLLEPARACRDRHFMVAGPMYPDSVHWPDNVTRREHVPPDEHRAFYHAQRYTLNLTRADMAASGYAPSVRLFEAAACATPVITDYWEGLDTFFKAGVEILVADSDQDVMHLLNDIPEARRRRIGAAARSRALGHHTALHRALSLERYHEEALRQQRQRRSA